jgi:hypothetical protein
MLFPVLPELRTSTPIHTTLATVLVIVHISVPLEKSCSKGHTSSASGKVGFPRKASKKAKSFMSIGYIYTHCGR